MSADARTTLEVPGYFGPERIAAWSSAWSGVADAAELELRLPSRGLLAPAGIVTLAAGIAARAEGGRTTSLATPESGDVIRYLQRVDFFDELGVALDERFRRHPERGRFAPLRRIVDLTIGREVADAAAACIEAQYPGLAPSISRMARFILEELGANVVQHSARPRTGFGMAQAYRTQRRLQIAFADCGVGFLASLQRNPELAGCIQDDGEPIQLALERGLTGSSGAGNIGIGLAMLRTFADVLNAELWIASGSALLRRRTVGSARVSSVQPISPWNGSIVCLDAPLAPTSGDGASLAREPDVDDE